MEGNVDGERKPGLFPDDRLAELFAEIKKLRQQQEKALDAIKGLRAVDSRKLPTVLKRRDAARELGISTRKLKTWIRDRHIITTADKQIPSSEIERLAAPIERVVEKPRERKRRSQKAEIAAMRALARRR